MEKKLVKKTIFTCLVASSLIFQACAFNQLIPATNQPELVNLNIDSLKETACTLAEFSYIDDSNNKKNPIKLLYTEFN